MVGAVVGVSERAEALGGTLETRLAEARRRSAQRVLAEAEIGEALEDAEKLLVPGPSPDLHVAGTALRTERPEPRQLVAALPSRVHTEAAERGYETKSLVLAGLSSATIPICLGGK